MTDNETKRLPRLTAILTQLQTKRLTTATELSKKFSVSVRTIYRDIRALEQSGVPIVTEDGKGYTLIEGYQLPPIMFTENEANALITAEQLVLKNTDASFVKDYTDAIDKIKAVLRYSLKDKAIFFQSGRVLARIWDRERSSNNLSELQLAIANFNVSKIGYTNESGDISTRLIEPFAVLSLPDKWLLVAYCRLRKEFRYFRLDRITSLYILPETFDAHDMTLQEFFNRFY